MKISKRQKISGVLWSKFFASHNSGCTTDFHYSTENGGSVSHLEFYGVENFRCNRTKVQVKQGHHRCDPSTLENNFENDLTKNNNVKFTPVGEGGSGR